MEKAGYSHVYAVGPRKKHGCLIAFKKDMFNLLSQKLIAYDDQEVRRSSGAVNIHGSSFRTKNIGNLVALCRTDKPLDGLLVATTHLFWHPSSVCYHFSPFRQLINHPSHRSDIRMSVPGTVFSFLRWKRRERIRCILGKRRYFSAK